LATGPRGLNGPSKSIKAGHKRLLAVGGLEPAYGHFAEWHLAGRFHLNGIKIGYAPHVNVGHHYVGDMVDLEIFTRDFTEGEMLCISRPDTRSVACSRLRPNGKTGRDGVSR